MAQAAASHTRSAGHPPCLPSGCERQPPPCNPHPKAHPAAAGHAPGLVHPQQPPPLTLTLPLNPPPGCERRVAALRNTVWLGAGWRTGLLGRGRLVQQQGWGAGGVTEETGGRGGGGPRLPPCSDDPHARPTHPTRRLVCMAPRQRPLLSPGCPSCLALPPCLLRGGAECSDPLTSTWTTTTPRPPFH